MLSSSLWSANVGNPTMAERCVCSKMDGIPRFMGSHSTNSWNELDLRFKDMNRENPCFQVANFLRSLALRDMRQFTRRSYAKYILASPIPICAPSFQISVVLYLTTQRPPLNDIFGWYRPPSQDVCLFCVLGHVMFLGSWPAKVVKVLFCPYYLGMIPLYIHHDSSEVRGHYNLPRTLYTNHSQALSLTAFSLG